MSKKTISLTINERLSALGILYAFKGGFDTLPFILDDIKSLTVSEEEWKEAERRVEISVIKKEDNKQMVIEESEFSSDKFNRIPGTNAQWRWKDEKVVKSFDLDIKSVNYLKEKIEEKDKNKEFTVQDSPFIKLSEKLI